jgi:hypothetical protein
MSIRRCPGCWNLVERDSVSCGVCGRGYVQALTARLARWLLTASALGSLTYFYFGHHI